MNLRRRESSRRGPSPRGLIPGRVPAVRRRPRPGLPTARCDPTPRRCLEEPLSVRPSVCAPSCVSPSGFEPETCGIERRDSDDEGSFAKRSVQVSVCLIVDDRRVPLFSLAHGSRTKLESSQLSGVVTDGPTEHDFRGRERTAVRGRSLASTRARCGPDGSKGAWSRASGSGRTAQMSRGRGQSHPARALRDFASRSAWM